MTAAAKRPRDPARRQPWWRRRQSREKVWTGIVVLVLVAFGAAVFWTQTQNSTNGAAGSVRTEEKVPVGQKVEPVKLEDSRTGAMFDLGQYLGKREMVLVAYMGDF